MPTIYGIIETQTDKAILFRYNSLLTAPGMKPYAVSGFSWFPLSQVTSIYLSATLTDEEDNLVISEWIAEKKGLYDELD
jgi:hypothetical protein